MIGNVVEYVKRLTAAQPKPWYVLGKGPSAAAFTQLPTSQIHIWTLNHACKLVTPAVAHFVDLDAFEECHSVLRSLVDSCPVKVCLPWHPHVNNRPVRITLKDYCKSSWMLQEFKERLLSYNATTAHKLPANPELPRVRLRFFSAVAAFNVLGQAGIKEVFSLGVDGGLEYASFFEDKDRLKNGRDSFDAQTSEIELALKTFKMTWTKHDGRTGNP